MCQHDLASVCAGRDKVAVCTHMCMQFVCMRVDVAEVRVCVCVSLVCALLLLCDVCQRCPNEIVFTRVFCFCVFAVAVCVCLA